MPLTTAQKVALGPPGLEGTHHWFGIAGYEAILNTQPALPRYKLDRITGLYSLPEADDVRAARTSQIGEAIYPSYARGKTITYEGRVQGRTLQELRSTAQALRGAFANRTDEHQMLMSYDPGYPEVGSYKWSFFARVLQLDMDDEQTLGPGDMPTEFQRIFTVGLRLSDPRFYLWQADGGSASSSSGMQASGATAVAHNFGNYPTDPWYVVTVNASATVTLTNSDVAVPGGATARLRWALPSDVPNGSTMRVNFRSRTATIDGYGDVMPYWDASYSNWWDEVMPGLMPGDNHLSATGVVNWTANWWNTSV